MAILAARQFTINDLERLSGVKAHTLRVWERRYSFLFPLRTSGNLRLYTIDQLKLVLDIALLKDYGCRISTLAENSLSVLQEKLNRLAYEEAGWRKAVNELMLTMLGPSPECFEDKLNVMLTVWSPGVVVEKILYPFLHKTNLLWTGHKLYQEHIVVTAARKKIIYAIESLPHRPKTGKQVLLFLSDTRQLDLGLLYSNYLLKRHGYRILYFGNDITPANFIEIFHLHAPAFLFTYIAAPCNATIDAILQQPGFLDSGCTLVIGNYKSGMPVLHSKQLVRNGFEEALDFLIGKL